MECEWIHEGYPHLVCPHGLHNGIFHHVGQAETKCNHLARCVPVREEAKLVPIITKFRLADVLRVGGLPLPGFLDEKPKESTYLINVIFVSNKFVIHTVSLETVCVFTILTAEETAGFLRDRRPKYLWYLERT